MLMISKINYVPEYPEINTCKYADDCNQDEQVNHGKENHMQEVLDSMNSWVEVNKMSLNAKKTKDMWICFKQSIPEPPNLPGIKTI
jgi:hypothetical protein